MPRESGLVAKDAAGRIATLGGTIIRVSATLRRDRVLLAGAVLCLGFTVGGLGELTMRESGAIRDLVVASVIALGLRPRWLAASRPPDETPEA
jgi:hypothetical protein